MIRVLRWITRAMSVVILVMMVTLFIGYGGGPSLFTLSPLLTMLLGLLIGWKWEGIGGVLILGGFALFAIVNGPIRLNGFIVAWLVTGLLYLVCWWLSRKSGQALAAR